MDISGKTVICGLIGDPVEHSMSPAMQNAAFRELRLDYAYVAFRVRSEDIGSAIAGMRALGLRGLNVTIPHKMAVIRFLDRLDPLASKIGAVNTIVNDGGTLTGYNTDAGGFLQPLHERKFNPQGKMIVVVGAGGAARGIAFALSEEAARLVILNRTADKAQVLAEQIRQHYAHGAKGMELNESNLAAAMANADMVVNATSVGMGAGRGETPIPARVLRRIAVVYDIVYNPLKTKLISEGESAGCVTISGAEMLAWQGALAFEKWTAHKAPIELMKQEVIRHLKNED